MTTSPPQPNILFTLMRDVSEAIKLDRTEKNEDAYKKYLECVLRVSTALLKDLFSEGGHVRMTQDKLKMVKLGQQCMDRVALIVNGRFDEGHTARLNVKMEHVKRINPVFMDGFENLPAVSKNKQAVPPDKGPPTSLPISSPSPNKSREVTPSPSQQSVQITSPDVMKPSQPISSNTLLQSLKKQKKLTPMEMAAQRNQQLLSAFKARQKQSSQGKRNRDFSANLSLTLQRKMAENLAIAKAQEEILAKKMKERQERLEEQASKRFLTPVGLSEEEQHQRLIYRKVLEFEQEELWMIDERKKLEQTPTNITVISQLISVILNCDSHPLTEQIKMYQNKLLNKLCDLVDNKADRVNRIKVPLDSEMTLELKSLKESSLNIGDKRNKFVELEAESQREFKDDIQINNPEESNHGTKGTREKTDKRARESDKEKAKISADEGPIRKRKEDKNIESVTDEIKSDIKSAIRKGELVKQKLKKEEKAVKSMCRQATEDYEKYNQENMDELFDDDSHSSEEAGAVSDSDTDLDDKQSISDNVNNDEELEFELKSCLSSVKKFTDSEALVSKLKNEAYLRHLKGVIEDILTSIERVQVLFVIAFQELDSAEGRDQCNVLLEGYFFRPLWSSLLLLFRLANEPKELAISSYMTEKQSALPGEFGVRDRLCLLPSESDDGYPYDASIKELVGIAHCPTMLEKLDCLVRTSKMVLQDVEYYYKQKESEVPDIGADDLLPIVCYIVAQSRLPQIVSECHAMDKFIHEGYMFGEEGYCLTSFQTAINYLVSQGMKKI